MRRSRAVLRLVRKGPDTRIAAMRADAPQRLSAGAPGDWLTVYHQLLGDGFFPGEAASLAVAAGPGTKTYLTAAAATPLRAGQPSLAAARLSVEAGATLVYAPGALLPHAGAIYGGALTADVAPGGACVVIQVLLPGRTAHESGGFQALRLRTRGVVAGQLAIAEDLRVEPCDWPRGAGALLTVLAIGETPLADPDWWAAPAFDLLAASPLRAGGCAARALLPSLSDAAALAGAMMHAIRTTRPIEMKFCSSLGKLSETRWQAG